MTDWLEGRGQKVEKVSRERFSKYKVRHLEAWKSKGKGAEGREAELGFRGVQSEDNCISVQWAFRDSSLMFKRE